MAFLLQHLLEYIFPTRHFVNALSYEKTPALKLRKSSFTFNSLYNSYSLYYKYVFLLGKAKKSIEYSPVPDVSQ